LIDSGKALSGYEATFMTASSDFSALPDSATVIVAEQDNSGSGWEVGALVFEEAPVDAGPPDAAVPDTAVPDAGFPDAAATADSQPDPDAGPPADGRPGTSSDAAIDPVTPRDDPSLNAPSGLAGGCALAPSSALFSAPAALVLWILLLVARLSGRWS
jgi:hypothetical protein